MTAVTAWTKEEKGKIVAGNETRQKVIDPLYVKVFEKY